VGGIACRRPGYRGGDSAKAVPSSPIARKFAADTSLCARVRVRMRLCVLPTPLPTHRPCLSSSYTPNLPPPATPKITFDQR